MRIVLAFVDPPEIVGVVNRLACRVKSG